MDIDLSVPIWTIDHVAAALHVQVDTAREHTYTGSFPAPVEGFSRNLWLREEVLAWFAGLPRTQRRRRDGARPDRIQTATVARRALAAAPAGPGPSPAARTQRKIKPYKPRAK